MRFSERTQLVALIVGAALTFAALSIVVMAILLCFTKSIILLKGITGLGTFMAVVIVGLYYAFSRSSINKDGEIEL